MKAIKKKVKQTVNKGEEKKKSVRIYTTRVFSVGFQLIIKR